MGRYKKVEADPAIFFLQALCQHDLPRCRFDAEGVHQARGVKKHVGEGLQPGLRMRRLVVAFPDCPRSVSRIVIELLEQPILADQVLGPLL